MLAFKGTTECCDFGVGSDIVFLGKLAAMTASPLRLDQTIASVFIVREYCKTLGSVTARLEGCQAVFLSSNFAITRRNLE